MILNFLDNILMLIFLPPFLPPIDSRVAGVAPPNRTSHIRARIVECLPVLIQAGHGDVPPDPSATPVRDVARGRLSCRCVRAES